MRIIFNDVIQFSNADPSLKTPALSETAAVSSPLTITLDKPRPINAIGIGNTDGTYFNVMLNGKALAFTFAGNGLYCQNEPITVSQLTIDTDATYIGRLAAGLGVSIPTAIAKEPGFSSTSAPRITLSGQVIPGAGGYNYRTVSLDSRYKITETIMDEIKEGYPFIGLGYPFFIDLTDEAYKLPFAKLYANDKDQQSLSFESGVTRYLYSRRWQFLERF